MTLDMFCIELKKRGITKKQAAKEMGYSKDHFLKVVSRKQPLTNKFLYDLNTYIEMKIKLTPTVIDREVDISDCDEFGIYHHNEFQKLKQTNLYKSLMQLI